MSALQDTRKHTGPPQIVIVDFNSGADGDIVAVAAALQKQVQEQFALAPPYGWGLTATVRAANNQQDITSEEWVMGLYATIDQPDELGYHDRTAGGKPLIKLCPSLDAREGTPWPQTGSHELLETLLDPELSRCAQSPSGHFWALEVCDFVESESYFIDGICVSNFNLPFAFEPPSSIQSDTAYDWLGASTAPFQIRPGGYGQWWDGRKWVQAMPRTTMKRSSRMILDSHGLSRHARRARLHTRSHFGDPRFMM